MLLGRLRLGVRLLTPLPVLLPLDLPHFLHGGGRGWYLWKAAGGQALAFQAGCGPPGQPSRGGLLCQASPEPASQLCRTRIQALTSSSSATRCAAAARRSSASASTPASAGTSLARLMAACCISSLCGAAGDTGVAGERIRHLHNSHTLP